MKRTERLFPSGVPVLKENLAGRQKEINYIKQLLKTGQSVILYGPRRIGKTSLALTILYELKQEGFFTGRTDIFETATLPILSQRITKTTLENKKLSQIINVLKNNLSQIFKNIQFKQTIDEYEWLLKFAEKDYDESELFSDVLNFPEKFAKKNKTHMIMFFDEIGDIKKFNGENIIKLMRSKFQLHNNVTYLFAGSQQSVIENIFVNKTGPFYRFGQLIRIRNIEKDIFKKYIKTKFDKVQVEYTDKAINYILEITQGHPYYTQLICREIYFYSLTNKVSVNKYIVDIAINEALNIEELYLSKIWEEISKNSSQVQLLQNITENITKVYNQNRKNSINISRTLNQLIKKGLITKKSKGNYKITDPLFVEYLKRIFA